MTSTNAHVLSLVERLSRVSFGKLRTSPSKHRHSKFPRLREQFNIMGILQGEF